MSGVWSAGVSTPAACHQAICGGDQSNAIAAAAGAGTAVKTTYEFNGSSWSTGGELPVSRSRGQSGDNGDANNAIVAGGYTGSTVVAVTYEYNGTAWSSGGSLGTARQVHTSCGNADNCLAVSGLTSAGAYILTSEAYNGTAWSYAENFDSTGFQIGTSAGNSSAAIAMGGYDGTNYLSTLKIFNGSSWSTSGSLTVARRELGGGGTTTAAIAFGGTTGSVVATTDEYNGTSCSAGGNLSAAKRMCSGGCSVSGGNASGICIGGYISSAVSTVEYYSWSIPVEEIIRSAATNRNSATSRLERFDPILLTNPPVVLTTPTYDGSGQTVHPSVVFTEGGFAGYQYWMGITPYPNGNDDYENPSLIASTDGLNWEVPSGITNPLATKPSDHNSDCALVWDSPTLYLYYVEMLSGGTHTIYRFPITEDPLTVGTKVACTIDYSATILSPSVVKNGANDWVMWFIDSNLNLRRYTSTDGLAWGNGTIVGMYSISTGLSISSIVPWHLSVKKYGNRFLFMIAAYPYGGNSGQTDLYWGICETQDDALRIDTSPILTEFAGWGSRQAYLGCALQMANGSYRLYVSAATTASVWRTGYADIALW